MLLTTSWLSITKIVCNGNTLKTPVLLPLVISKELNIGLRCYSDFLGFNFLCIAFIRNDPYFIYTFFYQPVVFVFCNVMDLKYRHRCSLSIREIKLCKTAAEF